MNADSSLDMNANDNANQNASMNADRAERGARWFAVGGAGLLAVAGYFAWTELALDPRYALTVAALLATGAALSRRRWFALAAFAGLIACAAVGGAAYFTEPSDALLVGLVVAAAGAAAHALRGWLGGDEDGARRALVSHGWVASALLASGALYLRFVTLGVGADHVARRLALTLTWLAIGIVVVTVRARGKWHAGYLFVLVATAKALFYDTLRLDGGLRVATLALAGVFLLGGAWLLRRRPAARAG